MIPTLPFGRTGHNSTRIIFGAAALGNVSQADTDRTMELIIRHGINHIDTAASYGESELRLGPWLATHRDQFFVATKTGERTGGPAYDSIRRSLDRMRIDRIDLLQLHCLVEDDEWETAMGPGGALEAAQRAQAEGLITHIGVTGHGVTVAAQHLRSLAAYPFVSVLLPYNYAMMQNPDYAADFETLAATCAGQNVALQTIKAITRAPWGDRTHTANTWYEPLTDPADIDRAVNWVLGRPGVYLNTVGDIDLLPLVLDAAERWEANTRPTDAEMAAFSEERELAPLFV